MDDKFELELDPFAPKSKEKYPVAQKPEPKKHSQQRRFRSYFIVGAFYYDKIRLLQAHIRYAGKCLRIVPETKTMSGWKPNKEIVDFDDLRNELLKASVRDIVARI